MRKISIILVLLSAMVLLLGFEVVPETGAFHPKVLAALGFILLCAYTFGAIAQRFGLPQVVGYIATGVLFGPHLTHLVLGGGAQALFNDSVVDDIKIINGLAIGLIGLTAGGELKLNDLRKDARSIGAIISAQTIITPILVGGGIFALGKIFPTTLPFLTDTTSLGAAALVFGTLAIGTSPATTLAVVTETRAKGPLTNLLLGSVIAKDATTVLAFLIALQIAVGWATGSAFDAWAILWELGMSVVVGLVMGLVIIVYLRFVNAELVLFTVTMVFVGQALAEAWHLEALLAFIVAGFIVENGPGGQGERMIHELERLSLPVFVVFFTVAAARLELAALADYWPVALVYVGFRSVSMATGTWFGTKVTRAAPVAQAHLWYALFPQAGVTLSLAGLLAGKVIWAAEFETIVMATILVHIIVGPILAKLALTRSGEGEGSSDNAEEAAVEVPLLQISESLTPSPVESYTARGASFGDVELVTPDLEHDALNQHATRLKVRLERILADTEDTYFRERERRLRGVFQRVEVALYEVLQESAARLEDLDDLSREQLPPQDSDEVPAWEDREALKRIIREGRAHLVEVVMDILVAEGTESAYTEPTDRFLQQFIGLVDETSRTDRIVLDVPQEPARRRPAPGDSGWVTAIKTLKSVVHPVIGRDRAVNVEILHRCMLTLGLPTELVDTANFLGSERLYMWRKVRIFYGLADDVYQEALQHLDSPDLVLVARQEAVRPVPIATTQEVRALNLADIENWRQPTSVDIALIEDAIAAEPILRDAARSDTLAIHELTTFFGKRIAELREDGDRARTDMRSFSIDARRRLAMSVARPYANMVAAMHIAGTFELPQRSLTPARRFEEYRIGRQGILTAIQNWRTLNTGFASSIALELEVRRVESRLREVLLHTLKDIDRELLSTLSYHAAEFGERVIEAQQRLELAISPGGQVAAARKAVVQERALLLAFVHETALADIHELRESRRFSHLIDRLMNSLKHIVEDGPEIIRIATRESASVVDGGSIEGLEVLEIPLQQVLREALEREVAVHLSDVELRLMGLIERVAAEILEVSRIVGFNLEAAATELLSSGEAFPPEADFTGPLSAGRRRRNRIQPTRTSEGELTVAGVDLPTEFAIGGLERAAERLDLLIERVRTEGDGIEDSIRLEAVKQIRQVHELLSEGSPQALRKFLAQRDLQQGAGEIAEQAGLVARWSRGAYNWTKDKLRPVRDDLRAELLVDPDEVTNQNLYGEAARLEELLEVWDRGNLPEIYRRLYSPTPTDVADFFVPRNEILDDFRRAAVHWLQGHVCTIAVVGDIGAGRTSFIDYALHTTLEGLPTVRRSLNRTVTSEARLVEELSALAGGKVEKDLKRLKLRLSNRKDRTVAVVEQAEHLFLRSVDGMETLRRFLWMVGETSDSVLWILSMNTHAWRFLDNVMQVSDTFTHVLPLRALNATELESLIMTRHRVSGYRLVFDEDLHGIRRLRHVLEALIPGRDEDNDPQELLRKTYFERLHDISGGNPMLGVYHWLRSVSQLEHEHDLLHVTHIEPVELEFLDQLDTDKLLALANVVLHNGLSIKELADVFRIETQEAQAILGFLKALRLLYVDPGAENHYRLHRVLDAAVVKRLKKHKML
jgi:Kef-type K+ transport system membrane component KefB